MFLIQILLPHSPSDVPDNRFARTRMELVNAFEGVTAFVRSPAVGLWTAPDGEVERDDVIMVEVVVDAFDREWWRAYERTLAARFRQKVIHIRALSVEVV